MNHYKKSIIKTGKKFHGGNREYYVRLVRSKRGFLVKQIVRA